MRWLDGSTRWTWVWVNSGNLWWTGRPGVLRLMGLQRFGHDWAAELNWTEVILIQVVWDFTGIKIAQNPKRRKAVPGFTRLPSYSGVRPWHYCAKQCYCLSYKGLPAIRKEDPFLSHISCNLCSLSYTKTSQSFEKVASEPDWILPQTSTLPLWAGK